MNTARIASRTAPDDMARIRSWMGHLMSAPEHLPISFRYGEEKISGIPATWTPARRTHRIDANVIETVFEGTDGATGLQVSVECLEYRDYPVVEWTTWLTNSGDQPTPILRDIRALDASFAGASPAVYHCNGDFYSEDGYTPQETPLRGGDAFGLAPRGGRPCDGAFPYVRLLFDGGGLTIAIGWPGQWSARFTGTENGVHVEAGQELTNLRLMPGESIRTPRMTVLAWNGDTARAVNLWRRWYLSHVLPRPDGQPLAPRLVAAGTDDGEEFTAATEDNQIKYQARFKAAGFEYDVWWIDAGWYPCYNEEHERKWVLTGTWEPDAERFPHGFKPIADNAARNGANLLVWFEPERVARDTWLFKNHPEWLLRIDSTEEGYAKYSLLNLGNPECRRWLIDYLCAFIQDNGIGIYRQDFNFAPLRYWRENEPEDRQGITENLHVQGYLQVWDDLLARNPGLWIDSCASGGRRNDLETMRRSVPLHYTDYGYGIHPVKLAFHHTLYAWIPYFKECILSWDLNKPGDDTRFNQQLDSFSFHCAMAPMLFLTMDIRRDGYDVVLARKMVEIWRRASGLLLHGDYHPLTPFSRDADRWVVWQFDRPEADEGLIQGIRHAACAEDSITVFPQAFEPNRDYVLENPETGETIERSGTALVSEGFTFTLPRRSGAIWFYHGKTAAHQ